MDFISWLVVGALFMLGQFGVRSFYLLATGLACVYPAYAAYLDASTGTQMMVFSLGAVIHALAVFGLLKLKPSDPATEAPTDIGQRVEVIEWIDEGTARVNYRGKEWIADKAQAEMPDAPFGIIKSVQYGRLIITTGQPEGNA